MGWNIAWNRLVVPRRSLQNTWFKSDWTRDITVINGSHSEFKPCWKSNTTNASACILPTAILRRMRIVLPIESVLVHVSLKAFVCCHLREMRKSKNGRLYVNLTSIDILIRLQTLISWMVPCNLICSARWRNLCMFDVAASSPKARLKNAAWRKSSSWSLSKSWLVNRSAQSRNRHQEL